MYYSGDYYIVFEKKTGLFSVGRASIQVEREINLSLSQILSIFAQRYCFG
jgi:hypothetical protein